MDVNSLRIARIHKSAKNEKVGIFYEHYGVASHTESFSASIRCGTPMYVFYIGPTQEDRRLELEEIESLKTQLVAEKQKADRVSGVTRNAGAACGRCRRLN